MMAPITSVNQPPEGTLSMFEVRNARSISASGTAIASTTRRGHAQFLRIMK
jgi:hypothetical protein